MAYFCRDIANGWLYRKRRKLIFTYIIITIHTCTECTVKNGGINVHLTTWRYAKHFHSPDVSAVKSSQDNPLSLTSVSMVKKWNESGFRPPLCTYRLNWARRTSWGWWDDWDDTVLQTQDSKFEPWRSEAEHATSRSRRLPTILTFTRGWGRNIFVPFKPPRPGTEPRTLAWKAAVLTTTLGPPPSKHGKLSVGDHND